MADLAIENKLLDPDFASKTIAQIEKDFHRCNLPIHLKNHYLKEEIEQQIKQTIESLTATKLQQLIYLIDIPEHQFLKILSEPFPMLALSESILRREALKVYIRTYF